MLPRPIENFVKRLEEAIPTRTVPGMTAPQKIAAWREFGEMVGRMIEGLRSAERRIARLELAVFPVDGPPPDPIPVPQPPPPGAELAPRTYNRSDRSDARYCVAGLPRDVTGAYVDGGGYRYDENGLSLGGRDNDRIVPGLKSSDSMDGAGPCDPYSHEGRHFPPWPAESYER